MNAKLGSLADEFYASTRLFLKLDMPLERGTVLHFFEQIKKAFPSMRRFRRREGGGLILEENVEQRGSRRWVRLDSASLRFGYYAPPQAGDISAMASVILEQAPYHLGFSELDFDHMEMVYGFDLEYRGNHDQLVAETLWANHPLAGFLMEDDAEQIIDAQPYFGIAITADCELQAYAEVKSRTNTFEVRTGEFEPQPLSVFLTIRKYWGFGETDPLPVAYQTMLEIANDIATNRVVPILVNPLAQAIASRS